jgi:hypothetical protein
MAPMGELAKITGVAKLVTVTVGQLVTIAEKLAEDLGDLGMVDGFAGFID